MGERHNSLHHRRVIACHSTSLGRSSGTFASVITESVAALADLLVRARTFFGIEGMVVSPRFRACLFAVSAQICPVFSNQAGVYVQVNALQSVKPIEKRV
jgi:hypothetical protein